MMTMSIMMWCDPLIDNAAGSDLPETSWLRKTETDEDKERCPAVN